MAIKISSDELGVYRWQLGSPRLDMRPDGRRLMANEIDNVEPPALPLPTEEYDRPAADQSNNVLRLFFNRLASIAEHTAEHG